MDDINFINSTHGDPKTKSFDQQLFRTLHHLAQNRKTWRQLTTTVALNTAIQVEDRENNKLIKRKRKLEQIATITSQSQRRRIDEEVQEMETD